MFKELARRTLAESAALKAELARDEGVMDAFARAVDLMLQAVRAGNKLMLCGNGGSAADAQHIAAELTGRFGYDRPPLAAMALHCDTSHLTAVANDYGYDEVFARMVQAVGRPGDVLVGLSTSGNSPNVVKAFEAARALGVGTVGFTGQGGGRLSALSDAWVAVPSDVVARIQECHLLLGHAACEAIESAMFPRTP